MGPTGPLNAIMAATQEDCAGFSGFYRSRSPIESPNQRILNGTAAVRSHGERCSPPPPALKE